MKPIILSLIWVLIALIPGLANGQGGIIRGSILDDTSGESLYGVTVLIKGGSTGTVTDFEGKFEIQVDPGTYTLQASFISFNTLEISEVEVEQGDVTLLENLKMKEETAELGAVTVTAAAIRTTESALMAVKRNAPNLLDGIASSTFRQIGDGDAASAVKRVTGVSIEGGKYIFVRGLGDRYTKTVLNGMDIPGLDPDRNSIQMDIFPTNVIDNIIVSKTFTADLSSDFTGGIVDIETKDFPEEKNMQISVSAGFNPSMHFNNNYLTYPGGKTDMLGFDDGSRSIPTGGKLDIPQFANVIGNPTSPLGQEYQGYLRSFNTTLGGMRQGSLMDMGLSFSLGNQVARDKVTWGYNLALTYKNETEFYQDAEFNLYAKPREITQKELEPLEMQKGDYGVNNVLLGGLAGIALKTDHSKYRLNFLHLQNGESKAGEFSFVNSNLGANFEAKQHNLEYSERSLSNLLFAGSHFLRSGVWQIDWRISPTRSVISDPDIRFTRFRLPNNTISSEVGLPERIWRFLEEDNLVGKIDLTHNYSLLGSNSKLKFGANYTFKERDFDIQAFQFATGNTLFTGDPNQILLEENLFRESNRNGIRFNPNFIPNNPNQYNSNINNMALYVSTEINPLEDLRAIVGIRMEKFTQRYSGTNQNATIVLDNEIVLDDMDFFPTLNLIYALKENQNLRLSATRTIARPSFKEMSYAEILDPITGRSFIGGMFQETTNGGTDLLWDGNLTSTRINNFDMRWESFQKKGQMLSVSGFYKSFDKPIEIVQFLSDPGSFQPRNVGRGTVLGVELEFRKSLEFLSPALSNFSWNANVTLTESQIRMSESEFISRKLTSREGENVDQTRDMAGQAPYILNTGLAYQSFTHGWDAGVFYNVQGPTLNFVGFGNRTDTYAVPFHSVNLNINKSFGTEERFQAGLNIQNLLNEKKEFIFESYEAQDQIFTRLAPGTKVSLRLGYSF